MMNAECEMMNDLGKGLFSLTSTLRYFLIQHSSFRIHHFVRIGRARGVQTVPTHEHAAWRQWLAQSACRRY